MSFFDIMCGSKQLEGLGVCPMRVLDKVHVKFGIVALAHNVLKVAGIPATFR
jgi:hypothetical protein